MLSSGGHKAGEDGIHDGYTDFSIIGNVLVLKLVKGTWCACYFIYLILYVKIFLLHILTFNKKFLRN